MTDGLVLLGCLVCDQLKWDPQLAHYPSSKKQMTPSFNRDMLILLRQVSTCALCHLLFAFCFM